MLFIFVLVSIVVIPILYFFLGLQVISLGDYVRSGFEKEFRIITDIGRYGDYTDFLYLVIALFSITIGSFLWKAVFSYDARTRYKTRFKTLEERKRVSRIAGRNESKKGTQRLEFDKEGHNLQNNTLRGRIDILFDPLKRLWNDTISAD